mmetsp:Transcript_8492/g.34950  ORF Transcript_8492/g.34950 Transcript_8492/m.34950 type:complete len:230 (+) Transcript_8492:1003-1692(+)
MPPATSEVANDAPLRSACRWTALSAYDADTRSTAPSPSRSAAATSRTLAASTTRCVHDGFSRTTTPRTFDATTTSSSPSPSTSAAATAWAPATSLASVVVVHDAPPSADTWRSTVPLANLALTISARPSPSRSAHRRPYGASALLLLLAPPAWTTCSVHAAPAPRFSCHATTSSSSAEEPVTASRSPSASTSHSTTLSGPAPMPSLSSEMSTSRHCVPAPSTFSCHAKR